MALKTNVSYRDLVFYKILCLIFNSLKKNNWHLHILIGFAWSIFSSLLETSIKCGFWLWSWWTPEGRHSHWGRAWCWDQWSESTGTSFGWCPGLSCAAQRNHRVGSRCSRPSGEVCKIKNRATLCYISEQKYRTLFILTVRHVDTSRLISFWRVRSDITDITGTCRNLQHFCKTWYMDWTT